MNEPFGEQADIEPMLSRVEIDLFFFARKQIEKERCQPGLIQRLRNKLVPRAVPAAAASVDKKDKYRRGLRCGERTVEHRCSCWNTNLRLCIAVQFSSLVLPRIRTTFSWLQLVRLV